MNCREAERLIDTFFDGELDGRSMRDAAMHITRCKRCEAELNDRERVQKALAAAIEAETSGIDLSRVWAAVEPVIDAAAPAAGRLAPLAALPGARALRAVRLASRLRLAAAAQPDGLVVGGTSEDDLDLAGGSWRTEPRTGSRLWRWSVAGAAALAASVILAVALIPSENAEEAPRVAGMASEESSPSSARVALSPARPATRPNPAGVAPFAFAQSDAAGGGRGAAKQVQVESVNFPRSSVAMWSEPASDTTVIWVEDEELPPGR